MTATDTRNDLASLTRDELRGFFKERRLPAFRGDQVFEWIWSKGARSFDAMPNLPGALRERLNAEAKITFPEVAQVTVSEDGTRKLLVKLQDGLQVESVIIPDGDRATLCISSQVGCALACAFCATGTMGLTRHLSPGEIAGQVALAGDVLRADPGGLELRPERPITNIVYMGMGEPLHNYAGTLASLRILIDEKGFNYAPRRITVSTVGLVPRMLELCEQIPVVLAVSLHAADDELRGQIMPVNRRYNLRAVIEACRKVPLRTRERITFEYVLMAGVNDTKVDADRLIALVGDMRCKVNVIPFNEHPGAPFSRPIDSHIDRFDRRLRDGGLLTFVRRTRGRDIAAACGQLAVAEPRRPGASSGPSSAPAPPSGGAAAAPPAPSAPPVPAAPSAPSAPPID